jgi:hypothetical protein
MLTSEFAIVVVDMDASAIETADQGSCLYRQDTGARRPTTGVPIVLPFPSVVGGVTGLFYISWFVAASLDRNFLTGRSSGSAVKARDKDGAQTTAECIGDA